MQFENSQQIHFHIHTPEQATTGKRRCVPTCWALADKATDVIPTSTLVQTGGAETLVYFHLTVSPFKSCTNKKNKFSSKLLLLRNGDTFQEDLSHNIG